MYRDGMAISLACFYLINIRKVESFRHLPDWKIRTNVGCLAVTEIILVCACLGRIQTHDLCSRKSVKSHSDQ